MNDLRLVTFFFLTQAGKEYSKQQPASIANSYKLALQQVKACGGRISPFKNCKIEMIR